MLSIEIWDNLFNPRNARGFAHQLWGRNPDENIDGMKKALKYSNSIGIRLFQTSDEEKSQFEEVLPDGN